MCKSEALGAAGLAYSHKVLTNTAVQSLHHILDDARYLHMTKHRIEHKLDAAVYQHASAAAVICISDLLERSGYHC